MNNVYELRYADQNKRARIVVGKGFEKRQAIDDLLAARPGIKVVVSDASGDREDEIWGR